VDCIVTLLKRQSLFLYSENKETRILSQDTAVTEAFTLQ
jgi:hypothetical protein